MPSHPLNFILEDHSDTQSLGRLIADQAGPGLCILLEGDIGAGKTYLARCIIQTLLSKEGIHEDVPSPTFTLVQVYETGAFETWHADLYRLGSPDELVELGLDDAFEQSFSLIEWPDRMGDMAPENAVRLSLAITDQPEVRHCRITAPAGPLASALSDFADRKGQGLREEQRTAFLAQSGWKSAEFSAVAGDASNRRYDRLTHVSGETAILMDAPSELGEDVVPFLEIAAHLTEYGLSAPRIFASDTSAGFVLMEDLGDSLIARLVARDPTQELPLYRAIAQTLIAFQTLPVPADLPLFDNAAMQDAAMLPADWYLGRHMPLSISARAAYSQRLAQMLGLLSKRAPVLIHRDFHAENLLWLPDRDGAKRIGLLDFQDAMAGHPAYDLASLLSDARRDVSLELRRDIEAFFVSETAVDPAEFSRDLAITSAQRNLRILGIFARLAARDGKPHYAALAPRVWGNLMLDLDHPDLAEIAEFVRENFPPPVVEAEQIVAAHG